MTTSTTTDFKINLEDAENSIAKVIETVKNLDSLKSVDKIKSAENFKINFEEAAKVVTRTLDAIKEKIIARTYWVGSPFEFLATRGGPDDTGEWGEMYLMDMISQLTYFDIQWDGCKNKRPDGTYDLWFYLDGKKIRIEVKASRYGKSESWQHENIIREGDPCDKLVFVDFEYSKSWVTILDYNTELFFDMQHPVFGTTPCLRDKKTSKSRKDKYKWDFRRLQIERGIENSLTYCHDLTNPDFQSFSEFLFSKLTP